MSTQFTTTDDVWRVAQAAVTMTALDFMRGVLAGDLPDTGLTQHLHIRLQEAEAGYVLLVASPQIEQRDKLGRVENGFVTTMLENALTCAARSTLPLGYTAAMTGFTVHNEKSILPQVGRVLCEARVINPTNEFTLVEARVYDDAGIIYAHATGQFITLPFMQQRGSFSRYATAHKETL